MQGSNTASPLTADAVGVPTIADRYTVERVLGRGGMGEVLAVVERGTQQRFALKRLLPGAKARHAMLLEREFHTLSSLQHPNIVRAFDFGLSEGVPYYTMELLEGADIEALAPLAWTEVVPILRDLASALSIIHARHLVHRDVGARNVWRTPDGSVKLIDFGALTSFGASGDLAGTPPYVAPEALRTHVLDQRTDLYSLGALAYLLVTGRHAFPARSLAELESHWAEGCVAPNARLAELERSDLPALPEGLEQLIEALLAPLPEARPFSAAEVLDRLDALVPGMGAVTKVALDGVLASKAFVGRQLERKRLRVALKRALSNMGGSIAVLGAEGAGRSRLLVEFGIEARLAGAHVMHVTGDGGRSAFAAAARATVQLVQALPSVARDAAARHRAVLGHVSEELRQALDVAPEALERIPDLPGEARARVQNALHDFWLRVCAHKPLVLVLDDLQNMDEASLALFSALGREASRTQFLIVASVRTLPTGAVPEAAQAFVEKAVVLPLPGLMLDECIEMLRSIFGDAEHLSRTAQHLSQAAEGNPRRLMELCEYLVHDDKIRCSDGVWVLPQELSELHLPASGAQLDEARLARSSEGARALAKALSVLSGTIPLELCSALSPLPAAGLFAALDELCAHGVLEPSEIGYRFRSESLRSALCLGLDKVEAQHAHAKAGEALCTLESRTLVQELSAGVHFFQAGQAQRGARVMHRALIEVLHHRPEDHVEIGRLVEEGYGHVQTLPVTDHEKLPYLCLLAWAGFFVDRRYGYTYGDDALACARRVSGMDLARRLSRWLGRKLGLYVALICAGIALRRRAKKGQLVPDLKDALVLTSTAVGSLAGMYTVCLARNKVVECAKVIEPLTALGPDHAMSIVHRFVLGCAGSLSDHLAQARRHWEELLARLDEPKPIQGFDDAMRAYYLAASLYAAGNGECFRDQSRALELAERLEQQPLKLYQVSAHQVRAHFYAQRGNMAESSRSKALVEMCALQRGMTWQVEIWSPSNTVALAMRQRDAMALKRAAGQLHHLSHDAPALRDYVDYARASYLLLRSRPDEALPLLEALCQRRSPEQVGFANLMGLTAQAYNALNRFADADRTATLALQALEADDRAFPALTLRPAIEQALARAGLGRHEEAAALLDALIAEHTPYEGPLTLGALHDARANVALRAKQETDARRHFEEMERWYRSTDCPNLIQHCDRIARRWTANRSRSADPAFIPSMSFLATISGRLTSALIQESPEELVRQLVQGTRATEGVLVYTTSEGGHRWVASRSEELPEGLRAWVDQRISAALVYTTATEDAEEKPEDPNVIELQGKSWRLFFMISDQRGAETVVGAVALCNPLTAVPLDVLRTLAEHLHGEQKRLPAAELA